MAQEEKHAGGQKPEGQEGFTPASPAKRTAAWVGVVYMVLLVLLNLYPFYTGGTYLAGVGPLLVCPGGVGMAVLCLLQLRQAECPGWKRCVLAGLAVLCVIVVLLGLADGLPALIAGLGGQTHG
mgnify:CR=1 FL=1